MNIEILKDLFSAFNIILLFYILGERMEKRVTKKLRLVLGLVIAIMLSIIENSLHTHIIYSFILITIISLSAGRIIWKYSLKYCFIINCIFLSFISLAQVLACTIEYIQTEKFLLELPDNYQIQMLIMSEIIITIGVLISVKLIRKIPTQINTLNFITIVIPNLISIIVMLLLGDKLYYSTYMFTNIESVITIMLAGFVLIIGSMCNVVLLEYYLNAKQIESEKKLQLKEMSLQYDYYVRLERDMDGVRRIAHDIRNHLEALRGSKDEKEKEEYIGSIENKLERYESYYNTGNAFIDGILHRKKIDAIEQGIELKILADLRPFANMKNEDLCVVISNILDNALRECELRKKEEPGKENLIQLRAGKFRGFLSIVCENSIRKNQAKYVVSSREIQTTKPDKSHHGYGIKNVKNIVRKYGGEYSIQVRDGMFCFSIIVPL